MNVRGTQEKTVGENPHEMGTCGQCQVYLYRGKLWHDSCYFILVLYLEYRAACPAFRAMRAGAPGEGKTRDTF